MTPAQGDPHAAARLAALKANLDARRVLTRLNADSLAVLHPDSGDQVDTITCAPRPSDFDRWWFWDCTNTPIAPAGDVIGAGLAILGNLRRSGINA